ncbi:MAG: helix-turn-helix transcriptional regulator [Vampirovibrio sp.]
MCTSPTTMTDVNTMKPTLATFIQQRRLARSLNLAQVAEKSGIALGILEQLEEGRLLFLSVMNRGRLARVLKCVPQELKQYEREAPHVQTGAVALEHVNVHHIAFFNNGKRLPLKEMERHPEGFWPCPDCGGELLTRTHLREDLDYQAWLVFKLRCSHCLFKLDHEVRAETL